MRMVKRVMPLVAAGLLAAACSSASDGGSGDGGAAKGAEAALPVAVSGPNPDVVPHGEEEKLKLTPLPATSAPLLEKLKLTPLPATSAPLLEKVQHSLRQDVLTAAHVLGTTTATCAAGITQKAGAVSQCTATYEGAEIPYEVKISDSYRDGSSVISYTRTPKKGLLVAKFVYGQLNEQYGPESGRTDASKLACQELPVAKAFDFNTDTGYTCQYWSKSGKEGKPGYVTLKVLMGSHNISLQEAR